MRRKHVFYKNQPENLDRVLVFISSHLAAKRQQIDSKSSFLHAVKCARLDKPAT